MKAHVRKTAGVTLLEIMIALLIMASVMIPISSIMGYGGAATSKDARRIAAMQILDKTMRQILQEPYGIIPMGNGLQTSFGGVALGNVVSSNGTVYTVILNCEFESPAVFAYQGVKVNSPAFKTDDPESGDFLAAENLSLSDCVKSFQVIVRWTEQQTIPVEISAVSYRADFTRRSG